VQDPQASWKRGKGLWKLDSRRLHFFKKLSYWREIQAQHRDIPRNRVLKDHSMHDLAQLLPECVDDLKRVEGFSERMRRSDGETIINMVEETLQTTENELPERLARPLPSTTKDSAKLLRELVQEKAAEIQVAAEILMRKKEYEELLRSGMNGDTYRLPDSMDDWRKNILQDLLLTKL